MSDLSSLIERIEAATGGDRELDAEIWLACTSGATRDKWSYIHKATGRECTVDETRDATRRLIIVPEYTTSIDAALTLLPEDCGWLVGNGRTRPDEPLGGARITSLNGDTVIAEAEAATPVLALLAAILRARQSEFINDKA